METCTSWRADKDSSLRSDSHCHDMYLVRCLWHCTLRISLCDMNKRPSCSLDLLPHDVVHEWHNAVPPVTVSTLFFQANPKAMLHVSPHYSAPSLAPSAPAKSRSMCTSSLILHIHRHRLHQNDMTYHRGTLILQLCLEDLCWYQNLFRSHKLLI